MSILKTAAALSMGLFVACAQSEPVAKEGTCQNAQPYRIQRQEMPINGVVRVVYEYLGPLGRGMIQSNVDEQKAIDFVCQKTASRWLADDHRDD